MCSQITQEAEDKADSSGEHLLATLAEETKKLMKKDSTLYLPILAQWHPQAAVASASLIHKLYGQKLVCTCYLTNITIPNFTQQRQLYTFPIIFYFDMVFCFYRDLSLTELSI